MNADESKCFAWCVENRGQLVHERNNADGKPRQPPSAAAKIRKEILLAKENDEPPNHNKIEGNEERKFHRESVSATASATALHRHNYRTDILP